MANKFDNMFDLNGLKEDAKKSENDGKKEVPFGTYEVIIENAELKESKTGKPMVSIWFRIIAGENEGQMIFYNQVVSEGFQLGIVYKMLSKIACTELHFDSFTALEDTLSACVGIELELEYSEGKKGFANYKVLQVFN